MSMKIFKTGLIWLWVSLAVFLLDQWTKGWASTHLGMYQPQEVTSFLNWTLMHNEGMAFSILADQPGWQRWFISAVAIIIVTWLLHWLYETPSHHRLLNIGLALIVGGAIGNTYDRLLLGYVVDFIEVYYKTFYWPAFNIADIAISCGAFFLILDMFIGENEDNQSS